jgi:Transposase DDE domain
MHYLYALLVCRTAEEAWTTQALRRKLYDGKMQVKMQAKWSRICTCYTVVAQHQSLHSIKVCIVCCAWCCCCATKNRPSRVKDPAKPRYVLLFSSDVALSAMKIVRFYKARFQMEFLFRDAKGWTGLEGCQAREEKALHFHFNAQPLFERGQRG